MQAHTKGCKGNRLRHRIRLVGESAQHKGFFQCRCRRLVHPHCGCFCRGMQRRAVFLWVPSQNHKKEPNKKTCPYVIFSTCGYLFPFGYPRDNLRQGVSCSQIFGVFSYGLSPSLAIPQWSVSEQPKRRMPLHPLPRFPSFVLS